MVLLRASSFVARMSMLSCALRVSRGFASLKKPPSLFSTLDTFQERHIGPDDAETFKMLSKLGYDSMDSLIEETVPSKIRLPSSSLDNSSIPVLSESQLHEKAKELGAFNKVYKNYIGMGYHTAVVPPVILRNVCHLDHILAIVKVFLGSGKSRLVYAVYALST
jgi:glycine dehydrogenase